MGLFNKKKKPETPHDNKGGFVSFILLNEISIDLDLLAKNLEEDWGITVSGKDIDGEKGSIVTELDGMTVAVSLMPGPIPNGEAISNAKTNWRWPEAVSIAEAHKAHILVAVLRGEQQLLNAAVLYVKLCASCLRQPNAAAINTLGSVLAPDFYRESAKAFIENDDFPILNLVFFGLYSNDNGETCCGYTYGMDVFGKKNIEIVNSSHKAEEIHIFMMDIASYVIEGDVTLQDGETIGFSAEQKLTITESAGLAIDESTLKIGF